MTLPHNFVYSKHESIIVTRTGRDVDMKTAKRWKLESESPVERERAQCCIIKQKTKAVRHLAVELAETITALLSWGQGSALHKWLAANQRKEAGCAFGYKGVGGAGLLTKYDGRVVDQKE